MDSTYPIDASTYLNVLKTLSYHEIKKLCSTRTKRPSSPPLVNREYVEGVNLKGAVLSPAGAWHQACQNQGLWRFMLERDFGSPVILPSNSDYLSFYAFLANNTKEINISSNGNPELIAQRMIGMSFEYGYDGMVKAMLNKYSASIKLRKWIEAYCSVNNANVYCQRYMPLLDNLLSDIDRSDKAGIQSDQFKSQTEKWILSQSLLDVLVRIPLSPLVNELVLPFGTMLDFTEPASFSTFDMIVDTEGGAYTLLRLSANSSKTVKISPEQRATAVNILTRM